MSRSEKKVPIIKDGGYGSKGKHWANKRVRINDIGNGNNYRKLYENYDIHDHISNLYGFNKIDGIPRYKYGKQRKLTIEEIMEYWRK